MGDHAFLVVDPMHTLEVGRATYRIAGNFRGVYILRISRKGSSLKPRNLIIESGCGQLECSLLPCSWCQCALKKASLLSSSGGLMSMPRHVPSSFVASDNKEVRHVIAQCT